MLLHSVRVGLHGVRVGFQAATTTAASTQRRSNPPLRGVRAASSTGPDAPGACAFVYGHRLSQTRSLHMHATRTCSHSLDITVYVVFGATGGIGSALAARLVAQPGATLVAVGRDTTKLDALTAQLQSAATSSPAILPLTADVTDSKQVCSRGVRSELRAD
jgi:hypothetical protein